MNSSPFERQQLNEQNLGYLITKKGFNKQKLLIVNLLKHLLLINKFVLVFKKNNINLLC